MRRVLCGLAAAVFVLHDAAVQAQQGSVQISAAAQAVTGDPQRTAGQYPFEPDFGVSWLQPGTRFGSFQIELRETRRADRLHLGRNYAALRDLKYGGVSWTFEAGDAYFTRTIGEYGFSNLATPAVTFTGGAITGRGARGTIHLIGGRATAWRNSFGTDPDTLAQRLGMARGAYRLNDRLEVLGRASRIKTSGLAEFSFSIADSKQAGGGVRFTLTPALQLIADGSFVQYRRVDSGIQHRDGSLLAGLNILVARGWLQVNAARLSPGEFPAINDPLHDRETVFAAGEYDVWSRVRLLGGWEGTRTNIDPELTLPASRESPRNIAARGFGGIRFQLGPRSTITVRAEEGGRIARPVGIGLDRESDTGLRAVEWQAAFGPTTAYARASRRDNVDHTIVDASYNQDEVSGQLFIRLSRSAQVFGLGTYTRHESGGEAGSSYWQAGGGAQVQLMQRSLWARGEGAVSRNVDLVTRDFVPRASFNIGLNGEAARGLSFAFNIAADRTPLLFGTGTPWTTRSMVRVMQNFSTGSAHVPTLSSAGAINRSRGTGAILGSVFTDWNGNGTLDPDESPIENIPIRILGVSSVVTRRDGEFSFLNVPVGPQQVGLDTSAIPVDFDPPVESSISIELDRGMTRRVSFGLIPLGSVRGRVVRDANANGRADPGEEPIEGVVLVLDGGARSEQVRRGMYRFDSIRSGDHVVSLLRESLPDGAVVTGIAQVPLSLGRDLLSAEIDFAVTIEKRPENRRVFPPRGGSPSPSPSPQPGAIERPATAASSSPAPMTAPSRTPRGGIGVPAPVQPRERAVVPPAATTVNPRNTVGLTFAVQVAALLDPLRARALVSELVAAGYPAYLVAPGDEDPDGPYRIRVGSYRTKAEAAAAAASLGRIRNQKLWVIRDADARAGDPGLNR